MKRGLTGEETVKHVSRENVSSRKNKHKALAQRSLASLGTNKEIKCGWNRINKGVVVGMRLKEVTRPDPHQTLQELWLLPGVRWETKRGH